MNSHLEIQKMQANLAQKTQEERDYIRFGLEQRIRSQIWDSLVSQLPEEIKGAFDFHSELSLSDLSGFSGESNEN